MESSGVKWVRLGDYIEQCDERNTAGSNYPVIGINRDKTFMPTVANLDGVDIAKGEFYQFNLSSCIRQQNSLTAQFVSFSLSNLANIFYPPQFLQ